MSRPRLLLDCDPGHDDALALIVAARHADLVGVTTVAGNAPLAQTTRNALIVCELAGIDVPVHRGADRPLVAEPRHAPAVHGASGLDGPELADPARRVSGDDAAAFIAQAAVAAPGLWLVPVGPFTNVALALRRDPGLAGRLAGISFMGGSAGAGNRTPVAEFNVWADPEAAAVMLGSGVRPLRMAGLDLTRQFVVEDTFLDALRAGRSPLAAFCADAVEFSLGRHAALSGRRAAPVHDVCAVLAITHPELVRHEPRAVVVELAGTHTRGMTVVDQRGYPASPGREASRDLSRDVSRDVSRGDRDEAESVDQGGPDAARPALVEVGYDIDAPAARAVLLDAILGGR